MTPLELTGRTRTHIAQHQNPQFAAHPDMAQAYFKMRIAAKKEGIEIHPFSAFRDFGSQLKIWNNKYLGKRPLYSKDGKELEHASLSKPELINTILMWSALPGASRHHWGTEVDVIDRAAIDENHHVELLPHEFSEGGVFQKMNSWLNNHMNDFGFFRPYGIFQGGVNTEPWHLSFNPISSIALNDLSIDVIAKAIQDEEVLGKDYILENLESIYSQYIINISM